MAESVGALKTEKTDGERVDHENETETVILETELGQMMFGPTSSYIRPGFHLAGDELYSYYLIARYYGPAPGLNGNTAKDIIYGGTPLSEKFKTVKF